MGDKFKINNEGKLEGFDEIYFDNEAELKKLVLDNPSIIIPPEEEYQLILVDEEVGIPQRHEGNNRWKIDLLFIGSDGIPTLVEVKQSTDSRIYREVIGQLLDYAAHGSRYWSIDFLKNSLKERLTKAGANYEKIFKKLIKKEWGEEDEFWKEVFSNLRTGYIRLVCVADELPNELKTTLEFLETYLEGIEVYGVQLAKFENDIFDRDFTRLFPNIPKSKIS